MRPSRPDRKIPLALGRGSRRAEPPRVVELAGVAALSVERPALVVLPFAPNA
jgi:hypothetical protein